MKRILRPLALLTAFLATACAQHSSTQTSHGGIRTGDLLFVGIPAGYSLNETDMASGIAEATGKGDINYIHTAILEVANDTTWIIDATIKRGVARYPLTDFLQDFKLKDGRNPVFEVMRPTGKAAELKQYVENAKAFIGQPYDVYFLPDNEKKYCTELVYDSYITKKGAHIFNAAPMNFLDKDGNMPQYWTKLFARLGQSVPQGIPGTNPQAMREEKVLTLLEHQIP